MPMCAARRKKEGTGDPARISNAERRRQLLGHAKQLFAQLGYGNTTTEQVAAAAGVRESVLLRHFGNKTALLREVLQELRVATLGRWSEAVASLSDPLAKLHAVVDLYLGTTRKQALEFH